MQVTLTRQLLVADSVTEEFLVDDTVTGEYLVDDTVTGKPVGGWHNDWITPGG